MKKTVVIVAAIVLIAGGAIWFFERGKGSIAALSGAGSTSIEEWIGVQLKTIANDHLRPEFTFISLDYEYPATVTLHEVELIDQGVAFVEATSVRIVFNERPSLGEPVVIESVDLVEPVVRLRRLQDGGLLGFTGIVETPDEGEREDGVSTRPSEVFAIRRIGIISGELIYEIPDAAPMCLDDITVDLECNPDEEQGWYALDGVLERTPALNLAIDASLNIDTFEMGIRSATLDMTLQPARYELLPPELRGFLIEHDVRGSLSAGISGSLSLVEPATGSLELSSLITNAFVSFDDYTLPIESLEMLARLENEIVWIEPLVVAGFGGTVQITGQVQSFSSIDSELEIDARGVRLEEILRGDGETEPKLAGRVDVSGKVLGSLALLPGSFTGAGAIDVTEGRLVNVMG